MLSLAYLEMYRQNSIISCSIYATTLSGLGILALQGLRRNLTEVILKNDN